MARVSLKALALLCLGFLLAGCPFESSVPLSAPTTLPANSPLLGTWVDNGGDTTTYYHVGNEGTVATKIIEVTFKKSGELHSETIDAWTTALNGKNYVTLKTLDNGKANYLLFQYSVDDKGTLALRVADYKFLADAIEKGLVKGNIYPRALIPHVSLSEDTPALQAFVAKYSDQIFTGETKEFHKAK